MIKILFGLCVAAVAGWSAWWYVGARGQEAGVEAWLDAQRQRGWQADMAAVAVEGYPFDFNLKAEELALADPRTGWSWRAPVLTAESAAHQPTRIAVTWPSEQTIAVPGERADIRSQKLETLLDLRPGPSMELREAASDVEALFITGQSGWEAAIETAVLRLSERPDDLSPPNSYDLRMTAERLTLPKQIVAQIDPTGWLDPFIGRLTVIGHGAFDQPLDRASIEQGRLALRAATIREAGFEWGDMRLTVRGAFEVDDDGYPDGEIKIEAREWRQMVRLAVSSKLIDRGTAETIRSAIEFLTRLTGGGDDLSAPLGLSGGKVRIGPIPIADAPRLAPPR